jgi:hypothetical protein
MRTGNGHSRQPAVALAHVGDRWNSETLFEFGQWQSRVHFDRPSNEKERTGAIPPLPIARNDSVAAAFILKVLSRYATNFVEIARFLRDDDGNLFHCSAPISTPCAVSFARLLTIVLSLYSCLE